MDKPKFPFTRPEYLCQTGYQEAYDALPEPYKNDSCLTFSLDEHGRLIQSWVWCPDCGEWLDPNHKVAPKY